MIKKIYATMDPAEKADHARLLALEINSYLSKIYKTMKPNKEHPDSIGMFERVKRHKCRLHRHYAILPQTHLPPHRISADDILLKHASAFATKMWEFRLNKRAEAAQGNVGKVVVATNGLDDEAVRKQRALFIAAEHYTYHAFANHPDPRMFRRIRCQNQYWDMLRAMIGLGNAHDTRDRAVRYVVEEIKEHKLAHYRGKGWHVGIAELKTHYPDIAQAVGSSEKTFNEIFRKQNQRFTPEMMKQEEDLVRKEAEDLEHLMELLKAHEKKKQPKHVKRLIDIHIADLKTFTDALNSIRKNLDSWVVADKKEHQDLRKKLNLTRADLQQLLQAEAEAEEIDINKIHLIFQHFKKEKINILRDLELIERAGAPTRKVRRR